MSILGFSTVEKCHLKMCLLLRLHRLLWRNFIREKADGKSECPFAKASQQQFEPDNRHFEPDNSLFCLGTLLRIVKCLATAQVSTC